MDNQNAETVKSVTGGAIVMYILGVVITIVGLATKNVGVILAGIILLPVVNLLSKKYLKINFSGWARLVIAILLIIGGAIFSSATKQVHEQVATDNAQAAAIENNAPVAEEYTEVITLKGKGNQDTESFNITGKKVRLTATTCCSSVGSFSGISLEEENGGYMGPGLSISTEGTEKGQGQTTYRSVDPGQYYVKVISGINWEVKVEQSN